MKNHLVLVAVIWAIAYAVPPYLVKTRELDLQEDKQRIEERSQRMERCQQKMAEDFVKSRIEFFNKEKTRLENWRKTI